MGTITTTDGTEIFYKDWGSGQPVVFSHGWPLSADDWDTQMLFFLRHGYRVIAHDRRGHGRSTQTSDGHDMDHYADDLAALTAHLDLRDAVHVGHSTGGGDCEDRDRMDIALVEHAGLTTGLQLCQKSTVSRAPASQATSFRNAGRHHLGIGGDFVGEISRGRLCITADRIRYSVLPNFAEWHAPFVLSPINPITDQSVYELPAICSRACHWC